MPGKRAKPAERSAKRRPRSALFAPGPRAPSEGVVGILDNAPIGQRRGAQAPESVVVVLGNV